VNLTAANLTAANLTRADLTRANLTEASFHAADLSRASVWNTIFANVDLGTAIGLEAVHHSGPSTIGIDTMYCSNGNIPEVFLRGAGVPDKMIRHCQLVEQLVQCSPGVPYSAHEPTIQQPL
jgi:uncharacterized protein YjbI with pentapeptide repeats